RRSRDRRFDDGKIAHEATHALEDYYRRPVGELERTEASGTWWFAEGLAEFIGAVDVKAVDDPGRPGGCRYEVTFLDRNENRWDTARRTLKSSMRFDSRAVFDEANIGLAAFGRLERTASRDWPFTLADLVDLRHGRDLDARAAVMFAALDDKRTARALQGLVGTLAYFQAWSLVAFLHEAGGERREALLRAYEARRHNKPHAVVNAAAFKGLDLDALEREWLAWIGRLLEAK
ncbi:MAG: hypothetical protein JXQ29_00930, partial [Planctomycetes bacterium]|nr:hypothetical protein [Planctomycetota bacterium]